MSLKDRVHTVAEALTNIFEIPTPTLGIDLDGTVDEAPIFFAVLTHRWPGKVIVITFRKDREKAIADLGKFGIRYDEVILVNSLEAKARIIKERGVSIYFDDQDEALQGIDHRTTVFKLRNGGNFDFASRRWLYLQSTGKQI